MPFLDWVNKNQAVQTSQKVPYRMLRAVSLTPATLGHGYARITQLCLPMDGYLGICPASNVYRGGSYRFTKHFYGSYLIHDLQERTPGGELSEEFLYARAIDPCPQIKHWVRNIERQEKTTFWLPTSTDYFYPDFVAELHDGWVLVIEYKGENLCGTKVSMEKRLIKIKW